MKRYLLLFAAVVAVLQGLTAYILTMKTNGDAAQRAPAFLAPIGGGQTISSPDARVLGSESAGIVISGDTQVRDVILLPMTEPPTVNVSSSGFDGIGKATLYKAYIDIVLEHLTQDDLGFLRREKIDTSTPSVVAKADIVLGAEDSSLPLPLEGMGIWYLQITAGDASSGVYVIRTNFTTTVGQDKENLVVTAGDGKSSAP